MGEAGLIGEESEVAQTKQNIKNTEEEGQTGRGQTTRKVLSH